MADISFHIACKELKILQIAQLNQLFQLLHLVHIYGHGFYKLSRMIMTKNVNNDVSQGFAHSQRTERTTSRKNPLVSKNNLTLSLVFPTISKFSMIRSEFCRPPMFAFCSLIEGKAISLLVSVQLAKSLLCGLFTVKK